MIDLLAHYAPMIGLLFFFFVFIGIAIWAWRPSAKKEFQRLGMIPLKEDTHD
jgi:cbb3-type cytochrome oxidase subunit 3